MGERKEKNWKETERLWCIKPTVMELDTCTATAPSCQWSVLLHCLEVHQNAEKHKQPDIRWSSVEHYQIRWDNMVLWDVRASSSSRANLMNSGVSLKLADVDDQVCVCVCVCVSINSCSCEFGSQSWFNRHLSPSCDRLQSLQSDSVFTFSMDIM